MEIPRFSLSRSVPRYIHTYVMGLHRRFVDFTQRELLGSKLYGYLLISEALYFI